MKNKTIAQQLGVTEFPFEIRDKNGNLIYHEFDNGYWEIREFKHNKLIYYEDSDGFIVDLNKTHTSRSRKIKGYA